MSANLPTGYILRRPTSHDAAEVAAVVTAGEVADFGEPDFTEHDLEHDWQRPRFDLGEDAWAVSGPTGRLVAYAYAWEQHPGRYVEGDAFVVPEYAGRGIGSRLMGLVEDRAAKLASEAPITLGVSASQVNEAKRDLLVRRGFTATMSLLRLKVDLARRPPRPSEVPDGLVVRAFRPSEDRAAVTQLYSDLYGHYHHFSAAALSEWLDLRLRHPAFDPALWRVAEADGEIVGAILVYDVGATGYVSNVAVRSDWRASGAPRVLLTEGLAALRTRGQMRVLVTVDADATPAALSLYEQAGMHTHEKHDLFEKIVPA